MKKINKMTISGLVIVFFALLVTIVTSWLLYEHTVKLLTQNLRERLETIAITASVNIDAEDIQNLRIESDWQKPSWQRVVTSMKKVREANKDIIFMYIFRKTINDPSKMEFVADSHSLYPYANTDNDPNNDVDVDRNGIIDAVDVLQWPGQEYPEPPKGAFDAYNGPTSNDELYTDAWGTYFTGYSPIKDEHGNVVAILAVDVRANEFLTITGQTLYPFLIFISFLVLVITVLALVLISIWNRRVELLAELDRQKDELIGLVSHQLAAPVSAVKWYVEMLLDGDLGKLNKEQSEQLQTVQETARSLADLVSMILDVSRIQLGRMKIEKQELDLNEFFKEIFVVVEPRAAEKKIQFNKNLPSSLPKAMLDKRYTRMTVENLMTNAIKYTPDAGKVDVNVRIEGNQMFVSVKDTGCGIPVKDQKQIFGKMYRASNVRNSTIDGNGFGLYVAKGAVESQGGQIWFESAEGKGTTFYVKLPLK